MEETNLNAKETGLLGTRARTTLLAVAALGAVAFLAGLTDSAARAWQSLLLHNFYFLALAAMGTFFIAVHRLARASWPASFRPVTAAMAGYLPVGAALMLALLLGVQTIYEWAAPGAADHDPLLAAKAAYLNLPGFSARMVAILGAWLGLGALLASPRGTAKPGLSALFVVVFMLTFSVAAVDWVMSLEPHWFSTLFPWYVLSSAFAGALALIVVLAIVLARRGALTGFGPAQRHDLGKYIFAFSVFWGYLWFSQYMLIWYADLPEEGPYYILRSGPWRGVFLANVAVNLGIPFVLLPAAWKRNEKLLLAVAAALVAGHWLDFYLLVMPSLMTDGPRLGWIEIGVGLGVAAGFMLAFDRAFGAGHGSPAPPNMGASSALPSA